MKVFFTSLGCDKNLTDSEVMLGKLSRAGYVITDEAEEADAIVINTCCFIGDAKEESIQTIIEMAEYKTEGSCKALIVTGCLAERYSDEIRTELPEVDGIVGTTAYDSIVDVLDEALKGNMPVRCGEISRSVPVSHERLLSTGGHYAYLKIAEGCDKNCTYCIIPKVRGHYRSFPMEDLVKEAERLAGLGVGELILVAQETTLYGKDLYGRKMLPELLRRLCRIEDIHWIRLMYCYPEEITDELIQVMRDEPRICHYIDMPIQHASDSVLKRMGRRTNAEELTDMIHRLRTEIPDIVIRTTLISGFPGETEEDHESLCAFVDEMEFQRLGVFTYSREENTRAYDMPDQVPDDISERRRDEIMLIQQEISAEYNEGMIGKTIEAFIEGYIPDDDVYVGRTYMDAPGVDGYIFIESRDRLTSGDFVPVKITGAMEYDLIGEFDDEFFEQD